MDNETIGARVRQVREQLGMTRVQFADRLGTTADEIRNIECDRLKRPAQKESFYRNVASEVGISIDWLKTGNGDMYGHQPSDEISMAFGELLARHDPVIDGFVSFLRSRSPEQLERIAQGLREIVPLIEEFSKKNEG